MRSLACCDVYENTAWPSVWHGMETTTMLGDVSKITVLAVPKSTCNQLPVDPCHGRAKPCLPSIAIRAWPGDKRRSGDGHRRALAQRHLHRARSRCAAAPRCCGSRGLTSGVHSIATGLARCRKPFHQFLTPRFANTCALIPSTSNARTLKA